jgi:hypothetical protein
MAFLFHLFLFSTNQYLLTINLFLYHENYLFDLLHPILLILLLIFYKILLNVS